MAKGIAKIYANLAWFGRNDFLSLRPAVIATDKDGTHAVEGKKREKETKE